MNKGYDKKNLWTPKVTVLLRGWDFFIPLERNWYNCVELQIVPSSERGFGAEGPVFVGQNHHLSCAIRGLSNHSDYRED